MKYFEDIDSVLSAESEVFGKEAEKTDRVLKSTKIEQMIYDDLSSDNDTLLSCVDSGKAKLTSFESLVNDVFQSVYGLSPKYNTESEMSFSAKTVGKQIIEELMKDDKYTAIKSVCEGKELPAISATEEFAESIYDNLDMLLEKTTGSKTDITNKLEEDRQKLAEKLSELLKKRENTGGNESLDKSIIGTANRILSKNEQKSGYESLVRENVRKSRNDIKAAVEIAAKKALESADMAQNIILAWGNGDAEMKKNELNSEILKRCYQSEKLKKIASFLGRYREVLNSKRLSGYRYGTGEKYDIELGNNLSKTLTQDIALLSSKELMPLFIRKYQKKELRQYRKREPEYKGKGDIIVCVDESSSTSGENNAYAMAVTMVLGEICRINKSNFAVVHFSSDIKVDCFYKKDALDRKKLLDCAETFLGGGTNFENPLSCAMVLAESKGFEKPDIVFITDGVCSVSDEIKQAFSGFKKKTGTKLTGILLDYGQSMEFSLKEFADKVYRTSELAQDTIAEKMIKENI